MFGHQPLVVYLCVSECICLCDIARRLIIHETVTSMPGTILTTMYQLLVCRVQYCQQCVKFWW